MLVTLFPNFSVPKRCGRGAAGCAVQQDAGVWRHAAALRPVRAGPAGLRPAQVPPRPRGQSPGGADTRHTSPYLQYDNMRQKQIDLYLSAVLQPAHLRLPRAGAGGETRDQAGATLPAAAAAGRGDAAGAGAGHPHLHPASPHRRPGAGGVAQTGELLELIRTN